jgi:hypothetical protein
MNLWIHSPEAGATVVWDRHDLLYAYGPLERIGAVLKESMQEGNVDGRLIRMYTCTMRNTTIRNEGSCVISSGPAAHC